MALSPAAYRWVVKEVLRRGKTHRQRYRVRDRSNEPAKPAKPAPLRVKAGTTLEHHWIEREVVRNGKTHRQWYRKKGPPPGYTPPPTQQKRALETFAKNAPPPKPPAPPKRRAVEVLAKHAERERKAAERLEKEAKKREERREKDRKRRAEKKADAERKKQAELKEFVERSKQRQAAYQREEAERQRRVQEAHGREKAALARRGGPQTRAEAIAALRKHVEHLHVGSTVRDHEVVNAYHALKQCGIEQLYTPRSRLRNLVLGAASVNRPHGRDHGTIDTITHEANGLYSSPQLHGQGYIKISQHVKDATPEEREHYARNTDAINTYRVAQGQKPLESGKPAPLGGSASEKLSPNYKVGVQDHQELTRVLVHEFGHAIHLEQTGPYHEIDAIVRRTFNESRKAVSGYGETDHREYFAEAHVAYRYRRAELQKTAPQAHAMVESVLRLRGMPL